MNGTENQPENLPVVENEIPKNEQPEQVGTEPETGLFGRLVGHSKAAFDRTVEVVKRGRGRPRKDGAAKASDVVREVAAAAPGATPGGAAAAPGSPGVPPASSSLSCLRPGLLRRAVAGFIKGLFCVPNMFVEKLATTKGFSRSEVSNLIEKVSPKDEEVDALAEVADFYLAKAEINPENHMLIAGVVTIGGIGARYAAVVVDLKRRDDVQKVVVE